MKKITNLFLAIVIFIYSFIGLLSPVLADEVSNANTGSNSINEASGSQTNEVSVDNSNQANISNNINLSNNTGDNSTSDNTGSGSVETGDVNSQTEVTNSDINSNAVDASNINTSSYIEASNSNTGSNSTNTATATSDTSVNVSAENNANITNDVTVDANTGNNNANRNTGDATIRTGDIDVYAQVTNRLINLNQIENLDPGVSHLTSNNSFTGSNSINTVSSLFDIDLSFIFDNNARIRNNITVLADTGNNNANDNTGDALIETGDININVDVLNECINVNLVNADLPEDCEEDAGGPGPGNPSDGNGGNGGGGNGGGGGDGGVSSSKAGEVLGAAIMPVTGGNFLINMTIIALAMLATGVYLRYYSSRGHKKTYRLLYR